MKLIKDSWIDKVDKIDRIDKIGKRFMKLIKDS